MGFYQDRTDQSKNGSCIRKDADHIGAPPSGRLAMTGFDGACCSPGFPPKCIRCHSPPVLDSAIAICYNIIEPSSISEGATVEEPRVTKGEQTQDLLVAAKWLFLSQGFAAVPVRQIAREVGITPTAIYIASVKPRFSRPCCRMPPPMTSCLPSLTSLGRFTGGSSAPDVSSCPGTTLRKEGVEKILTTHRVERFC